MLYFIRALRQIRFLLRQRNNNANKQLENSMMILVAEKILKKLKCSSVLLCITSIVGRIQ